MIRYDVFCVVRLNRMRETAPYVEAEARKQDALRNANTETEIEAVYRNYDDNILLAQWIESYSILEYTYWTDDNGDGLFKGLGLCQQIRGLGQFHCRTKIELLRKLNSWCDDVSREIRYFAKAKNALRCLERLERAKEDSKKIAHFVESHGAIS